MRVRIGALVFDAETRELTRDGVAQPLAPKLLDLLEFLLEERPRAVSRERLFERLWPDTHVAGTSLNRLVAELRAALGDDARDPRLIRTVPRFGYAFSGPAVDLATPAAPASGTDLWLLWGTEEIPLREGTHVIGRDPDALVRLGSPRVSRRHALIRVAGGEAVVEDLGSKNGTLVDGHVIQGPTLLRDRAEIAIGSQKILFRAVSPSLSTETARQPSRG